MLGALERKLGQAASQSSSHEYLQQRVQYDGDQRLMDREDKAVMMAWEGCATAISARLVVVCSLLHCDLQVLMQRGLGTSFCEGPPSVNILLTWKLINIAAHGPGQTHTGLIVLPEFICCCVNTARSWRLMRMPLPLLAVTS